MLYPAELRVRVVFQWVSRGANFLRHFQGTSTAPPKIISSGSITRLARLELGGLAKALKLKLQVLDQLGQLLAGMRICGLQRQSEGLGQLAFEFCAVSAVHSIAPAT
jgi:hypothetical protein